MKYLLLATLISGSLYAVDKCGYDEQDYLDEKFVCVRQSNNYITDEGEIVQCPNTQYIVSLPNGSFTCQDIGLLNNNFEVPLPTKGE